MSKEYDNYLLEHKNNVIKGLGWLADRINFIDPVAITNALDDAASHDESKYSPEEYGPYDAYFYGKNRSYAVVNDFNLAWLHHQHNNPHHWQHWVLVNDDPKDGTVALQMPLETAYEMIADWWSFSWSKGDLTEIFKWYDDHKERMILHKRTREQVEKILDAMKKELEKENDQAIEDGADSEHLGHHGIEGMKWGVRNGPPYPLDYEAKLRAVSNLNDEMNSKWDYGVLDNDEHRLDTEDYEWGKKYRTIPLDVLEKEKIGVCWDYVNYQHAKLKNMGLKDHAYMFVMQKSSDPDDIVTHTFSTFELNDKQYWIESAAWPKRGVHEINSYNDAAKELMNMYNIHDRPFSIFEYNPDGMDKGLTDQEFFNKATQNLIYDSAKKEKDGE